MLDYIIFTDGGARGNPGPAGAGAVIKDASGAIIGEYSEPLGHNTNNFAEYSAVLLGLKELKKLVKKELRKKVGVEVRLDSELVARQMNNIYAIKEETLFPLYIAVHNMLVSEFPKTTFVHVPREKNKEADRLSNKAMDTLL